MDFSKMKLRRIRYPMLNAQQRKNLRRIIRRVEYDEWDWYMLDERAVRVPRRKTNHAP